VHLSQQTLGKIVPSSEVCRFIDSVVLHAYVHHGCKTHHVVFATMITGKSTEKTFLSNVKPQKGENLFLNDRNEWMMGD